MFRVRGTALALVVCVCLGGVLVLAECTCEDLRKEIARCSSLAGDLARLACYDQLARECGLVAATGVPLPGSGTGKWETDISTNPLDDSKTVLLYLVADTGTTRLGNKPALVLRCKGGVTEVYIAWQMYLGSSASVTWRVGDTPATTSVWSLSTDKTATFYPGDKVAFIRQLLSATRFVAQVIPYGESPITAVFDLTGIVNAIKPLRETCGW